MRKGVDFHDGTVGLIAELVAHLVELADRVDEFLLGTAEPDFLRRLKAERFEPGQRFVVSLRFVPAFQVTEAVVRQYQTDSGLPVTGVMDERTWMAPAGAAGATLESLSGLIH